MNLSTYVTYWSYNVPVEWCQCVCGLKENEFGIEGFFSNVEWCTVHLGLKQKNKKLCVCLFFYLWTLHLLLVLWSGTPFTFSQDVNACLSQMDENLRQSICRICLNQPTWVFGKYLHIMHSIQICRSHLQHQ